ncbi:MAG: hypothetical protein K2O18_17395 [Oscillospiraceae bacterium]|nr:hypothetical protein [Oscillospiraceae bacterium]
MKNENMSKAKKSLHESYEAMGKALREVENTEGERSTKYDEIRYILHEIRRINLAIGDIMNREAEE